MSGDLKERGSFLSTTQAPRLGLREHHRRGGENILREEDQDVCCETLSFICDRNAAPMKSCNNIVAYQDPDNDTS